MKTIDFFIFLALLVVQENMVVDARAKGGGGSSTEGDEDEDEKVIRTSRNRDIKINGVTIVRFIIIFTLPIIVLCGLLIRNLSDKFIKKDDLSVEDKIEETL